MRHTIRWQEVNWPAWAAYGGAGTHSFAYESDCFQRALHIRMDCSHGVKPTHTGSRVGFDLNLEHGQQWKCCLEASPEIEGELIGFAGDPHASEKNAGGHADGPRIQCAEPLQSAFERGRDDLHALAFVGCTGLSGVAVGAPWFLAIFGRDALVTALMAGLDGVWMAEAGLDALARLQGKQRDDYRDEEPGKIPHEFRNDELTRQGALPYSPYYGTHDAPALYCMTLWHAWRWSGRRDLLDGYFEPARQALEWCGRLGNSDGDGLLEYITRSAKGYRNQGWKDADDAIVDSRGCQAKLPLATVELQGYWYAARFAMAELCRALGRENDARQLEAAAAALRQLVERKYWLEERQLYALALDGDKRAVDAISSNPGHLLWCGLPGPDRAAVLAHRLLQPELFSGWGLRTLSEKEPAYNLQSYQSGSVWPHDTLLACAGLWRYGFREEAATPMCGVLRAAGCFEDYRLPELFYGFDASCGFSVPYEQANIPQSWVAAVPLLAVRLFLGLVPDAPNNRCFLAPWLPAWLPQLQIEGIRVGDGTLNIALAGAGTKTAIVKQEARDLEIVRDRPQVPIMGCS